MLRMILLAGLFFVAGCDDSIQPKPVAPDEKRAFEKNPIDAAGVAEGDEQVSPFGKPSH